jgi:L-fucose mutarotase
MLKGIDPRLDADLLGTLRAMGHGDLLAVVDANFPAASVARGTTLGAPLRMGVSAPEAVAAILSVLPLDTFVEDFALRMEVVGDPDALPPVQAEVQTAIDAAEGRARPMTGVERFAFYEEARGGFAIVQTAERRFYGCFLLRKGVIGPEGAA